MREKVLLQNLTTLFVSLSKKWTTLERKCLDDSLYLRDCGGNSIIFCIEGSYLDKKAKEYDIDRVYYSGSKLRTTFDFKYNSDIRAIIKEERFDIIHCYGLECVWGFSTNLLKNRKIPLFVSCNNNFEKNRKSMISRWLMSRVDLVFNYSQTTQQMASRLLPIAQKKVVFTGAGVDTHMGAKKIPFEQKVICAFVSTNQELEQLKVLLFSMEFLKRAVKDLEFKLKLKFYSEKNWSDYKEYSELFKLVEALDLLADIEFCKLDRASNIMKETSIFIGTSFDEPFCDFELQASLSLIPTLVPRSASRQRVLKEFPGIGESYQSGNAAEFRSKLLKILIDEAVYQTKILDNIEEMKEQHGVDTYANKVFEQYTRLYEVRQRYAKRKKS